MKSVLFIAFTALLLIGCSQSDSARTASSVNFPDSVWVTRASHDSSIQATVFYWRDAQANFLAAERWCLGFEKNGTKWFIDYDLGEGKGSYEGGVLDIEWLDPSRVMIRRRIDDRDANLVFDLLSNKFSPAE